MAKGDQFKGDNRAYLNVNPGEESWSDRVEYYLKILTGKEIAPTDKVTITVDSAAFGKPADKTADATVLNVNPAQPYNSIQLLKAILLAQDEIEPRLSSINSVLNARLYALDANTNDVERLISSVATEIVSMKAAINNNLIDTKTVTQAILSKLNDPIPVVTNSNYFNSGLNSAVVITLGTAAGKKRLIDQITVSYAGGIGKGLLSVSEGTISYFKTAISLEGTQIVSFAKPISSTLDGTLTITLDPGGVDITGYLNVIVLEGEVGVSQGLSGQSAQTDRACLVGQPLYLKPNGHCDLAQANSAVVSNVCGLAISDTQPTFAAQYLSDGVIDRADWTPIIGAASLSIGSLYYLSPNSLGKLTSIAPTQPGQFVICVGVAISSQKFSIEIQPSILL